MKIGVGIVVSYSADAERCIQGRDRGESEVVGVFFIKGERSVGSR